MKRVIIKDGQIKYKDKDNKRKQKYTTITVCSGGKGH